MSRDLILWRKPTHKDGVSNCSFALHASSAAQIFITTGAVDGSDKSFTLVPYEDSEASSAVQDALLRFPHLRGCTAFRFEDSIKADSMAEIVQLQLCVSTADDGNISSVTGMQIAGLLDTEYVAICVSLPVQHLLYCSLTGATVYRSTTSLTAGNEAFTAQQYTSQSNECGVHWSCLRFCLQASALLLVFSSVKHITVAQVLQVLL